MLIKNHLVEITGKDSFKSKKGNTIERLFVLDETGKTVELVYFGEEKLDSVFTERGEYFVDLQIRDTYKGLSISVVAVANGN